MYNNLKIMDKIKKTKYTSPEVFVVESVSEEFMIQASGNFNDYNEDVFDWEN